ncbi:energy-coupling factor ABC transporter ATP-binding protein [Pseudaestuariivita atlantica]|uniref:Sulfate ABC transporter ATP-binding protein n=1 Tax=Pseudaestuariivita atlantica TaxID=1317121 RepID=A0A0L1JQB6_9RHOB|nr:ATP-binding cassette domain-containing protein [Pseudaestuariivita atlantica]KNG93926.1 sulfate ABC transporter ATP-binding protein [Pseudaestuariivita atlantica]
MSALFPLTVEGAKASRRGRVLVGPVDLTLDAKGITVVMGPNGSGKTTLLKLLHGTARLSAGRIAWACPPEDARPQLAFVFQRPVMLRRTVVQNIAYPLRLRGVSRASARAQALDWAARVGLDAMKGRPAWSLSGGEQQKLALARAFIADPRVVFLDEPTAALDGAATREIEAILAAARDEGRRLILATHDMGQARRLADDVVFLHQGRVAERAAAPNFFEAPATDAARAFLKGDIVE